MDSSSTTNIEDVYPLTPMQNGILFHTLQSEQSSSYLEQFVFDVLGKLDAARVAEAWTAVVNRHSALRAAFVWKGVDEPVQVVVRECEVPLREIDLTGRSPADVDLALADFLSEDRSMGFSLTEVPLMRLTLVRSDVGVVVVWTLHHLIMDGWSMPITISEVAAVYRAMTEGRKADLPQPRPFRDFVAWLSQQPTAEARGFWRTQLEGSPAFGLAPLLPGEHGEHRGTARRGRSYHDLGPELSAALVDTAQHAKVTLSTMFQAAWALLLARMTGTTDVMFGVTVSGRTADIADADGLVGVYINTLPQRVRVDEAQAVSDLLRTVQRQQLDTLPYQHLGLTEIQSTSTVPAGTPLFDSIVVFENYPRENPDFDLGGGSRLVVREVVEDTGYPLTLTILPRHPSIRLQLLYDSKLFSDDTATTLQGRLEAVLECIVEHADGVVRSVSALRREHADRLIATWNKSTAHVPAARLANSVAVSGTGEPHVHLLDHRLEPVPAGVRGMVHVVGSEYERATGCFARHLTDGSIVLLDKPGDGSNPVVAPAESRPADTFLERPGIRALMDLWSEVLDCAISDPDTDFFRTGGDSLAAVRLVGRIQMAFNTTITVNDVFEARTLRELVSRMDAELGCDAVDTFAVEYQDSRVSHP
jgi:acyl carrier protein